MRFALLLSVILSAVPAGSLAALPGVDPAVEKQLKLVNIVKTKRFVYDTAVGDNASSTVDSGAHGTGVFLPANAVIVRSWLGVIAQFVDAGVGTVAFFCEDANNIKTATDITGSAAGAFIEGQSTGAASAYVSSIAAACEIKGVIAGVSPSAGKLEGFVQYYTRATQ